MISSEEEVEILKKIVAKLLRKPEIAGLPPKKNEPPKLKKASGPKQPTLKAPAPVSHPVRQEPAPKPPSKPAPTGQIVKIPQANGTFREFEKVTDPTHGDYYLGKNGQKYILSRNEAGEHYMKSISRQSRPVGIKPIPNLDGNAMAMVASRQVQSAMQQDKLMAETFNAVTKSGV